MRLSGHLTPYHGTRVKVSGKLPGGNAAPRRECRARRGAARTSGARRQACRLVNALRCGRLHCYLTGPFFLVLAGVALLYGLGVLPLGSDPWGLLWTILAVGAVLACSSEWLFGRYRSSRR